MNLKMLFSFVSVFSLLLVLASSDVRAAESEAAVSTTPAKQAGQPGDLDYILKKYVDSEFFSYKELKANKKDHARFERFMEWQADADVKSMSREDQVAFYINAYNSCSTKAILDHYPVHTPLDVDGFFDKLKFKVGGEMLKLGGSDGDSMEYDRLIANYGDMRAHFAVVCAPPEVARLYDQAVESQWDANRDIAWDQLPEHHPDLERALDQVFTFLAENELSALYVPSRFVARIHPAYAEVAMFLSTQMADEARHIDVFLKRARAGGGGLGVSSATTSQSLLTLLELTDFTEAAFLLSVLGEGTFLDLLRFIEDHAPDDVTADIVQRARNDETRHVHFGLVHVRHALAHDKGLYQRLENAVRRRAATMAGAGGVPDALQDGLTILAAGSTSPKAVSQGHDAFRGLLDEMHHNRIKRLEHAGFTSDQAQTLSELHTPNFM
ncbi:MAG: DUF547 domain-containing protein [Planctomycetota bacterium]|nr:DUF547 domain-containing protein [Planctomycetota bacterium]MDA1249333.1 DUF547 domain-containing protein [Planctomycetota bacterium]